VNPEAAELLAQLRDIRSAPEAPFWPPAPGWWLLAVLAVLLLTWLGRRLLAARQLRLRRLRLLAALEAETAQFPADTQPQAFLGAINCLLKVVAIRAFPGQQCAGLQGEAWARFLAEHAPPAADAGALAVLATGPYQPQPGFEAEAVKSAARHWLAAHG
jgi:hypothetical protein